MDVVDYQVVGVLALTPHCSLWLRLLVNLLPSAGFIWERCSFE